MKACYQTLSGVTRQFSQSLSHNCVIWASETPKVTIEKSLHSLHIVVWAAISFNVSFQPFFFASTVNGDSYLHMLRTHFLPQSQQNGMIHFGIFQQEGAPLYFSRTVTAFLKEHFPARVIGRGFEISWPPKSPDLTPLDYWF